MKILNLFVVALFSVAISYGQSSQKALRTETINYKNGKATFQCYEDSKTGNLVKHGTFSFMENQKGEYGTQDVSIKGEFKDGYRNGSWTYTIKKVDAENQNGNYTTGTLTSTQNFKDGYPDGQWILNNQWKTRDRKYVDFKYVWGAYSNTESESATFAFKKGVMIGAVNYKEYGKSHTINLTQDGFATGSFIEENAGTTKEINFNSKGVITKYVERLSASGKVLNSIDFDNELLQIADAYLNKQKTDADLDDLSIKLDTIKGIAEDAGLMFYSDYFSLPGIDGDKTITEKGNIRVHGRYLKFERIKIVPFEEHPRWPKNAQGSKVKDYMLFLEYYGQEVSKEDNATINRLISDAKIEVYKSEAFDFLKEIRYNSIKNMYWLPEQTQKYKELSEINDYEIDKKYKESTQVLIDDYKELLAKATSKEDVDDVLQKAKNKYILITNSFLDTLVILKKQNDLLSFRKTNETTHNEIIRLYTVRDQIKSELLDKDVYKYTKKNLVNAYILCYNAFKEGDFEQTNKLKTLQDKMKILIKSETNDLEKSLKKISNTEQIYNLIIVM